MTQCQVGGCERNERLRRGWCRAHYERWRKHGDVKADEPIGLAAYAPDQKCSVPACDRDVFCRGWCTAHHKRWETHGHVLADIPVKESTGLSSRDLRKRRRRLQTLALIASAGGVCRDCGGAFAPAAYEFHHRDPEARDAGVTELLGQGLDAAITEAKKCDLLCGTCHNMRHATEALVRVA